MKIQERIVNVGGIAGFSIYEVNEKLVYNCDYWYRPIDEIIPFVRSKGIEIPTNPVIQFTTRWDWPNVQVWLPTAEEVQMGRYLADHHSKPRVADIQPANG